MDPIEKAIRAAFAKGDPEDRSFREKVYRSAFAALERALAANSDMSEDVRAHRRRALSSRISEIETEFIPAVAPVVAAPAAYPAAPRPQVEAPAPREADPAADGFRIDAADRLGHGRRAAPDDDYDPIAAPRRRGRGLMTVLLLLALVVAAVVAWFFASTLGFVGQTGTATQPQQEETSGASPQPQPASPQRLPGQADDLSGWIAIFDAADPTTMSASGGAAAEIVEEEGARFVRLSGGTVSFDVGQGVLEQVAGRRAVFNIVASAEEGETQFAVDCDLAGLGDCARRRFLAGLTQEDFLFEVTLESTRPAGGGTISVNADISGEGRSLDIHAIRVAPGG